jgi:hypothetical protein
LTADLFLVSPIQQKIVSMSSKAIPDRQRRNTLKRIVLAVAGALTLTDHEKGRSQTSQEEKLRREEWGRKAGEPARWAEEQEAREVERLFSDKPIRIRVGGRQWLIPANYFDPKGRDKPDTLDLDYFGFHLFLPDFRGFDRQNWRQSPFEPREIHVFDVSLVDKTRMIPLSDGGRKLITPAQYGDPNARFANARPSLEAQPSLSVYGLFGYRDLNPDSPILWTGNRSDGEFFLLSTTLAPGEKVSPGRIYPLCQAEYYSEKEDLHIAYLYSQQNFSKWREIDDAIWRKLHGWRVKQDKPE